MSSRAPPDPARPLRILPPEAGAERASAAETSGSERERDSRHPPKDPRQGPARWRRRRDWGGIVARLLCVLFAVLGVVPLALGVLVRLPSVQRWAAVESAALLAETVRVQASYRLSLQPWPFELALDDVRVEANDGGDPFLTARRVAVRPRLFALLDGELELAEVRVDEPKLRAVIADGALRNLDYELPESSGDGDRELPFSSVALTSADVDLTIDGARVRARQADLDLASEPLPAGGTALELALRSGIAALDWMRPDPSRAGDERADEDVICALDLRARLTPDELFVRRFELAGAADLDPALASRPSCELEETDWRRVNVKVEATRVALADGAIGEMAGRLAAKLPIPLVHRFVEIAPASGTVELQVDELSWKPGDRLPRLRGSLRGDDLSLDSKLIAGRVELDVELADDFIEARDIVAHWGGGEANIALATIDPFDPAIPLEARDIAVRGVTLEDMIHDLGGHPNAHVSWTLDEVLFERFGGTIAPLALAGELRTTTRDFGIYDRPSSSPARQPIMGVSRAEVRGNFRVVDHGILLDRFTVATGASRLFTTVLLSYENELEVTVEPPSVVDLRDVSPLAEVDLRGRLSLAAHVRGPYEDPRIRGTLSVDELAVEGHPLGDLSGADAEFVGLELRLKNAQLARGRSAARIPWLSLDFGHPGANLVIDGRVETAGPGMRARDFFEMVRLEHDDRFAALDGTAHGGARVHYVLGGKADRCGGGRLEVDGDLKLAGVTIAGERFDAGSADVRFSWDDMAAGEHGMMVELHSATLRKDGGSLMMRGTIRHGGRLEADVTVSAIPLASIDALGLAPGSDEGDERRVTPEGTISATGRLSGTLSRPRGDLDLALSPVRIGPAMLPASRLRVQMVPSSAPVTYLRHTQCGNGITPPGPTGPAGTVRIDGHAFGEQLAFRDVTVGESGQDAVAGTVTLRQLDLGALANAIPGVAFSAAAPAGHLSGTLVIERLSFKKLASTKATFTLEELLIARGRAQLTIAGAGAEIRIEDDAVVIPPLPVALRPHEKLTATVQLAGQIESLSRSPRVDLTATLQPVDASRIAGQLPRVTRAGGMLEANLRMHGPLARPELGGRLRLERGMLRVEGLPLPIDDIDLDVQVQNDEIRIARATARAGGSGWVGLTGSIPLRRLGLSEATATLVLRDIHLPLAEGIKATANATLALGEHAGPLEGDRALPHITGTVSLTSFTYARPMAFRVDLEQLAGKRRTLVETYDPEKDALSFDVRVVSPRPLRIANDLIDASLQIAPGGLRISGTNQRFGASGALRLDPGSKLFIQGHDFRVREGTVEFDDPVRIQPKLDVLAETEHRRYAAAQVETASADATGGTAGKWRITMHATGDTDSPHVAFSSDPPLSQDDIVLLLQVGMTRAELDRGLASSLAQSVSLEALSAVTGFDRALEKNVPLIDDFRLGSQYSSRTGRPEPTVTVGKRITDDVRATVTSGLSDNREVRSNIEWKLSRGVSVQGSYDNVNDVSSSAVGNIGIDLRWRLEFE